MLSKVKERWPADTKPLDFFPAFKQDSLQLVQTSHTDEVTESSSAPKLTEHYRNRMHEIRHPTEPTESSQTKEREKYSPFQTTQKPPGKP